MSLNKISLPPYLLTKFYSKSLVEAYDDTQEATNDEEFMTNTWKSLGNNQKNILIVTTYDGSVHVPDTHLIFLIQLLVACKLSLEDVAIININNYKKVEMNDILSHFKADKVFLFGINTNSFGFPFAIPPYQIQTFDGRMVLESGDIASIQNDKLAKTKLWASLKAIFNL